MIPLIKRSQQILRNRDGYEILIHTRFSDICPQMRERAVFDCRVKNLNESSEYFANLKITPLCQGKNGALIFKFS